MSIKNTKLGGTDLTDGEGITHTDFNDTFDAVQIQLEIKAWEKTPSWAVLSTGSADTNTTDKLVDSGATFVSDGVLAGMIVQNTTDGTFAIIDAVDSETSLSLRADTKAGSSTTDVFPLGTEDYEIYLNYELVGNWIECNGQVISNANSIYDGKTAPNLNASGGGTKRFLRGSTTSGTTGGSETHKHDTEPGTGMDYNVSNRQIAAASTLPSYYEVVWIMKI
jgi:hypothetical protein